MEQEQPKILRIWEQKKDRNLCILKNEKEKKNLH